jgi:hypothetical protein
MTGILIYSSIGTSQDALENKFLPEKSWKGYGLLLWSPMPQRTIYSMDFLTDIIYFCQFS